jgi:hypothetical protein
MKQIAFLTFCVIAYLLTSVSLAAAQDSIAVSFAVPSPEVTTPSPDGRLDPSPNLSPNLSPNSSPVAPPPPPSVQSQALSQVPTQAPTQAPSEASNPAPTVALSFSPDDFAGGTVPPNPEALDRTSPVAPKPAPESAPESTSDAALFSGGSESLVARTVGHAEGTRSVDGGKNPGYYGHLDPGNGVWNRGTFSYQFGNAENLSPEAADQRQLKRIKAHYDRAVVPKAEQLGLKLSLEEKLNAIDLANQAPLTVTESGGFVERLAIAKREKKLAADQATLEARVWSFWDTQKGRWDAPGLRAYDHVSKEESIRRDQDRRMKAIANALQEYPHWGVRTVRANCQSTGGQRIPQSLESPDQQCL